MMTTLPLRFSTAVIALAFTGMAAAQQPAVTSFSGGSQFAIFFGGSTGDVVGYTFMVNSAISVDSLGVWNGDTVAGSTGLTSDHQVGIWDSTQTLIASTTVTPSSPINGDFRYEAITPVPLSSGSMYTIGAMYTATDNDNYISGATTLTTAPEVTWLNSNSPTVTSLGFVFPATTGTTFGRLGPNFTFGTSMPECWLTLGTGGGYIPVIMGPGPIDFILLDPTRIFYVGDVTLTNQPDFQIPNNAYFQGVEIYSQVLMINFLEFPLDPIKASNGVRTTLGVGWEKYGPQTGMDHWANQVPALGGILDLTFSIL